MPARTPILASNVADKLIALGTQIRAHRKALRVSAASAAEATGMSRVTLHRIENGEPSVTMGAYLNFMEVLGMNFGIIKPNDLPAGAEHKGWIPARIRIADYPQLKQLTWQVHGTDELTPVEALNIYERNWRHVDEQALATHERELIDALRLGFSKGNELV